jgi:hypothetical protein
LRGELAGWLVLRVPAATAVPGPAAASADDAALSPGPPGAAAASPPGAGRERLYGMPLTTCALWRFGRALLGDKAPEADAQTCRDTP